MWNLLKSRKSKASLLKEINIARAALESAETWRILGSSALSGVAVSAARARVERLEKELRKK